MSKIQAISDGIGGYVYPVTITDAIIDPQTGEPIDFSALGAQEVEYTITAVGGGGSTVLHADENGNFTVTAVQLGAAVTGHTHGISDITNLQSTLETKENKVHSHDVVTSIVVNNTTLKGDVKLVGLGNVVCSTVGDTINISITPYTTAQTGALYDAVHTTENYELFIGTESEWETFKETMANNKRYLVFIRS